MNVSELARRLKVTTNQLTEALPSLGIDIGRRAIKIDDVLAQRVLKQWSSLAPGLLKKNKKEEIVPTEISGEPKEKPTLELPTIITVRDLAILLNVQVSKLIKILMDNGILAALNEKIDYETAAIIAGDLNFNVRQKEETEFNAQDILFQKDPVKEVLDGEKPESLHARPPVVVVMGHVDHGKTKLLDAIRKTNVVAQEAGGITQHIGAYQIEHPSKITFLDTPGHEAFTTMRSRGARIADIAILVVAADEGIKPQTIEALKIIKAAKLPFCVAVNKIDKPDANLDRIKRELSDQGYVPEDWGGTTICMPVSAKEGTGIKELLDIILLLCDMHKDLLVANSSGKTLCTVIESHIDKQEGIVATILVHTGTLKLNSYLIIDSVLYGKVRAMKDYTGKALTSAPPSTPVRIIGFKTPPVIGDFVIGMTVLDSTISKETKRTKTARATHFVVSQTTPSDESQQEKSLHLMLRTDALGSLEALVSSLMKLEHPEVSLKIISKSLGTITTTDVLTAEATKSFIAGFHVTASTDARDLAVEKNVEIKIYKIIYELLDDVKKRIENLLSPGINRVITGSAEVIEVFRQDKTSVIIGCRGLEGTLPKGSKAFIVRKGETIAEGTITNLKAGKQDISESRAGQEFGMEFESKIKPQKKDSIQSFREEKIQRTLEEQQ